jgi:protein-ribulosamine 3-kinase
VSAALARTLGVEPGSLRPLSGGDINEAWRVEPAQGPPFFAKSHPAPPPGMFAAEADGLRALGEIARRDELILVPTVRSVSETHLALEWIGARAADRGSASPAGGPPGSAEESLGRGLARLHRASAPAFGWRSDNWIGTLPQRNGWVPADAGAAAFFAERRLLPQVRRAAGTGALPAGCARDVERVCARLAQLVPDEPPALLHGDLWGGNWTADALGRPWIFDCAVSYGPREQELAFTQLFGGFSAAFYASYEEEWPLAPGWRRRVELWNLYPLLVHANLFGGSYGAQVARIAARWA